MAKHTFSKPEPLKPSLDPKILALIEEIRKEIAEIAERLSR